MLSRLIRNATAAASVISNNNKKFHSVCRIVSSDAVPKTSKSCDYVPSDCFIESCKSWPTAVNLFESKLSQGVYPISHYNFILSSLLQLGWHKTVLSLAQQLEEKSSESYVFPDIHTWKILIRCHCVNGNMSSAISLLHNIIDSGHQPCTKTLNHIFDGFCRIGEIHREGIRFYNDIVLKNGFQLNHSSYNILIGELCEIGESQIAIHLFRHALQIDPVDSGFILTCLFNEIISRLCKDRLVNQAYDLYSEMYHVSNIKHDAETYHHLIYGYSILGQFKQAIALFKELKASLPKKEFKASITVPPTPPTEREVKSAKSAVAVMIKGGVKPNIASYHCVADGIYNFGSRRLLNKIAQQKMETLLRFPKSRFGHRCYE